MTPPTLSTPGCPHCHEHAADLLDEDRATGRYYCNVCGRIFAALVRVPSRTEAA